MLHKNKLCWIQGVIPLYTIAALCRYLPRKVAVCRKIMLFFGDCSGKQVYLFGNLGIFSEDAPNMVRRWWQTALKFLNDSHVCPVQINYIL